MIGVNIDRLDGIISKLEDIHTSVNPNFKRVSDSIRNTNYSYNGQMLDYMFDCSIRNNIDPGKLISTYVEILKSVKKSYVKQDEIFSGQIQYINSKIR